MHTYMNMHVLYTQIQFYNNTNNDDDGDGDDDEQVQSMVLHQFIEKNKNKN